MIWVVRACGVAVLALTLWGDVWNAVTVRSRATDAVLGAEADAAPGYQQASWVVAALCAAVLVAILGRLAGVRAPRWGLLWAAVLVAVTASFVVLMGTATMWI